MGLLRGLSCFVVCVWSVCDVCAPIDAADRFAADVQCYYVDAHWVCRSFSQMRFAEFVRAWNVIVRLMTDESCSWRYFCDSKLAYQQFCAHVCGTATEFREQSIFAAWLIECRAYERFLSRYMFDVQYDVIVPPEQDVRGPSILSIQKASTMRLIEVMGTVSPDSLRIFYSFYFECAVNAFLRAIDFIDRTETFNQSDVRIVQEYKKILETVYQNFIQMCPQIDARVRRLTAFHYQRARSVWRKVCADKHLDLFAQDE